MSETTYIVHFIIFIVIYIYGIFSDLLFTYIHAQIFILYVPIIICIGTQMCILHVNIIYTIFHIIVHLMHLMHICRYVYVYTYV